MKIIKETSFAESVKGNEKTKVVLWESGKEYFLSEISEGESLIDNIFTEGIYTEAKGIFEFEKYVSEFFA
jgi:hypothetical protein